METTCRPSISWKASIADVIVLRKYADINAMQAGFLMRWAEADIWPETDYYGYADTLEGKMLRQLEEADYIHSDFINYAPTPKGEAFILAVRARRQTRINVRFGADLFPELAEIKECEGKNFPSGKVRRTAKRNPDPVAIRARAAATALRLKLKLMQMKY